ncbi:MAG: bifunctional adenosylcobinamide kinase/adenosylcobinamide-phosphate guanylyltransferase [Pseudomonadota bacterium]
MIFSKALIVGGARSGKSAFAETLLHGAPKPWTYIATAQAFDEEMKQRIALHTERRAEHWRMIEAPLDVATILADSSSDDAILLDCATLWLSNQMLADANIERVTKRLLDAVRAFQGIIVMVSNEVGSGIVPENALARRFRDAQGRLNQHLAAEADLVVLVTAGLPLVLKGALPPQST